MFLKEIKDYDEISNEADFIVSDGNYEIMCYCHPTEIYNIGTPVISIKSLFADNILRVNCKESIIFKLRDYYGYHLQGEVINTKPPAIRIGKLNITLDMPLPMDIKAGEYIELDVQRLECKF